MAHLALTSRQCRLAREHGQAESAALRFDLLACELDRRRKRRENDRPERPEPTPAQLPTLFPVLASNGAALLDDLGACTACTD